MDTQEKPGETPVVEATDQSLADKTVERCVRIISNLSAFKQARLDRIALYRDLYAGKVKKKYRQPFNVNLPVFSGAMDTLAAAFNDDLAVDLIEQEPADYIGVLKLNTLWQMELTSVAPNAKFALKTRQDRHNALFSGRGFMANYAVSSPEYKNCFEVFELEDAIFEPNGGGHLENHRWAGRQDIVRSVAQLRAGSYDQKQVEKLIAMAAQSDYDPSFDGQDAKASLSKFKAMGLTPENATFTGETMFKLVEMGIVINGTRHYIVFSPWYKVWLRFGKLRDLCSADLWPWVSWATHEDNKNFLSKSYADDMYGIADAVHTLLNQELTNREKRNFHPRGYDIEMFPDVAKLDQAQTRPDALVPVKVPNGKRIEDGIFTFETAELQGTITLLDWMQTEMGRDVGVTDLSMGGVQNVSKKATVVLSEQQNINKRLLLRSSSYTEAMGEIAKLFVQGCKDHLPAKKALKRLGIEGQGWEPVIRRTDLDLYGDVDVKITSSSLEMRNSQLKKAAREKALTDIGADPALSAIISPTWRAVEILRSVGEYDEADIKMALDTKNRGDKEEVAYAHAAIQAVQHGEKPDTFYGATSLFMKVVHDFAVNNRNTLGDRKYHTLIDFAMAHASIAEENMTRDAAQAALSTAQSPVPAEPSSITPPVSAPEMAI
ncbi:MAG: hypothetical protein ACK4UO_13030 [Pseudolabrys sp.]